MKPRKVIWILFFLVLYFDSYVIASSCLDLKDANWIAGCDEHHSCYKADKDCHPGDSEAYSCEEFVICKNMKNEDGSGKNKNIQKKYNRKWTEIKSCNEKTPGNDCYSSHNGCSIGESIFYSCDDFVICERREMRENPPVKNKFNILKKKSDESAK